MAIENESGKKRTTKSTPTEEPARKKAPASVSVQELLKDERGEFIRKLNEADPETLYTYQDHRNAMDPAYLAGKDMEVHMKDGNPVRFRNDIVCKMDRKQFEAQREKEAMVSRAVVEEMVDMERSTTFANPKSPKKLN